VAALQASVTALQNSSNGTSHAVYALDRFITVDPNPENGVTGPNIVISGANVHIVSGFGATPDFQTGLGNLIIGYDESPTNGVPSGGRAGGAQSYSWAL
jgi:hypothetical protein